MTWFPPYLTPSQREARRWHFAQQGQAKRQRPSELCAFYRISASGLRYWKHRLKILGVEGMKARPRPGRRRKISSEQEHRLQEWLQQPATHHGFPDPTWTCRRVRDVVGLKFGVWYHPSHVFKILRRMGFSYQKPEKRAIERNEPRIQAWITEKIPEIQRQVEAGETLVFLDETGLSLKTTTHRTWASRGKTPQVKTRMNWEKLSIIGALTNTGKFYQHSLGKACTGEQVVRFLRHLLKQIPGKMVIVLDNGGIHKSRSVQAFVSEQTRLRLEFLPPYAPELNPIERVWAVMKHHLLGNRLSKSLSELRKHLPGVWTRIRRMNLQAFSTSGPWSMKQKNAP